MPTKKSIRRRERYRSDPEFRARLCEINKRYRERKEGGNGEAVKKRWADWARKNPERRVQAERDRLSRPEVKRVRSARQVLLRKRPSDTVTADDVEVQALLVEIAREVREQQGSKKERRAKAERIRREDLQYRERHKDYCRSYYAANRERLVEAARQRRRSKST